MNRIIRNGVAMGMALLLHGLAERAAAQQFVVDDANIVDAGGCQVEAWYGQSSQWLLPACRLLPWTEVTTGIGLAPEGDGRLVKYAVQAKVLLVEARRGTPGLGFVAGVGMDRLGQVLGSRVSGVYAHVPVTVLLGAERAAAHANIGWHNERNHDGTHGTHHALTWGLRADVLVAPRLTLIGELFGEDQERPEYQAGLRSTLLTDRLQLDVSWGGHTERGAGGAGWTVGLAWTPRPWFRTPWQGGDDDA